MQIHAQHNLCMILMRHWSSLAYQVHHERRLKDFRRSSICQKLRRLDAAAGGRAEILDGNHHHVSSCPFFIFAFSNPSLLVIFVYLFLFRFACTGYLLPLPTAKEVTLEPWVGFLFCFFPGLFSFVYFHTYCATRD